MAKQKSNPVEQQLIQLGQEDVAKINTGVKAMAAIQDGDLQSAAWHLQRYMPPEAADNSAALASTPWQTRETGGAGPVKKAVVAAGAAALAVGAVQYGPGIYEDIKTAVSSNSADARADLGARDNLPNSWDGAYMLPDANGKIASPAPVEQPTKEEPAPAAVDVRGQQDKEEQAMQDYLKSDKRNQVIDEEVSPMTTFVAKALVDGTLGDTRAYYDKDNTDLGVKDYTGWGTLETAPQPEGSKKPFARVAIYFENGVPDVNKVGSYLGLSPDNRVNQVLFTKHTDLADETSSVPSWTVYYSDTTLGVNSSTTDINADPTVKSTGTGLAGRIQYIRTVSELQTFDKNAIAGLKKSMALVFPDIYPAK